MRWWNFLFSFFLWALILGAGYAMAQEPPPRERALMERVGLEINNNLTCSTNNQVLQDRVRELEEKLKAAEKKE